MAGGSVYKRSGTWAFRVDAGFHPESGKRRQVLRQGFATKKEAQLALADLIQAAEKNSVVAKSTMRLGDYLEEWLANQRRAPSSTESPEPAQSVPPKLVGTSPRATEILQRMRKRRRKLDPQDG